VAEVPIDTLREAIRSFHGCEATWVESVPVEETIEGQTVWEGVVHIFHLHGHPTATLCYTWSYAIDDSEKRRFVAVLHQGPVDSPQAAVRAAIVEEQGEPLANSD
jgi:hypothetical protein